MRGEGVLWRSRVARHVSAALTYARAIAGSHDGNSAAMDAERWMAGLGAEPCIEDLRELQARVVEQELTRLAPSPQTLMRWLNDALLVDLGHIVILSERAADELDRLTTYDECDPWPARSVS